MIVERELLHWKRGSYGRPFHFIDVQRGQGVAIAESFDAFDAEVKETDLKREEQALDRPDLLALKGLGRFSRFDAASQLRDLIENWTVSDFHITEARRAPDAGPAECLSASGDNLALYAQYLRDGHPDICEDAAPTPGISAVGCQSTAEREDRTMRRSKFSEVEARSRHRLERGADGSSLSCASRVKHVALLVRATLANGAKTADVCRRQGDLERDLPRVEGRT